MYCIIVSCDDGDYFSVFKEEDIASKDERIFNIVNTLTTTYSGRKTVTIETIEVLGYPNNSTIRSFEPDIQNSGMNHKFKEVI